MRVAIDARVSTDDKGQDPENQLGELRAWVTNSGHKISHEYVVITRAGGKARRSGSNLPPCLTMRRSGNSIACCFGH